MMRSGGGGQPALLIKSFFSEGFRRPSGFGKLVGIIVSIQNFSDDISISVSSPINNGFQAHLCHQLRVL
jgi:hypothetical protein